MSCLSFSYFSFLMCELDTGIVPLYSQSFLGKDIFKLFKKYVYIFII